jgi:hypothetical protein
VEEVIRRARIESSAGAQAVVAAADPAVLEAAGKNGLTARHLDTYSGEEAWDDAAHLSRDWYRVGTRDFSEYGGFSLGGMIEVDMFVFFSRLLDDVDRMLRLVSTEDPTAVWLGSEAPSTWARLLHAAAPGIKVQTLGGGARWTARTSGRQRGFTEWLKDASLDRQSQALALALRRPSFRASSNGRVLVIADIATPSVIGSLLPVIEALPADGTVVLATDPRIPALLKGVDRRLVTPTLADLSAGWRPYRRAGRAFRDRWREFRSCVAEGEKRFERGSTDLWPVVEPRLRRVFLRRFPFTLAETAVAESVLRRYSVKTIVTASHAHYAGRLYSEVGARLGIPSLSLQHGVAGVPSIYAPVHSTKMAVWGELPRLWLIANGAAAEQLVVTGQPRLDALVSPGPPRSRADVLGQLGLDPKRPSWIVAPDPEPREVRHAMTEMAFAIAAAFPDVQLIVRPHPADDVAYYKTTLASGLADGRFVLGTQVDAASLLAAADLAFVGQSTLGLEAMILGLPVVVLNPSRSFEFVPYVSEGAAPGVFDAGELEAVVTSLLGEERARFEAGRRRFVERYASAADGGSTARVIDLIRTMAQEST